MSIQKPQQESSYNPEDLETTLPTRFDQEKKPLTVTQLQPPGQQQKQNIPSITPSPQQTSIQPLQPTQQPDGQQQVINIMRMKSKPIEPNFKPLRVQDLKKDNVLPECTLVTCQTSTNEIRFWWVIKTCNFKSR